MGLLLWNQGGSNPLTPTEFHVFQQYFPEWKSFNVSCMNSNVILRGRPYGGISILYKMYSCKIEHFNFNSKRLCAIIFFIN